MNLEGLHDPDSINAVDVGEPGGGGGLHPRMGASASAAVPRPPVTIALLSD